MTSLLRSYRPLFYHRHSKMRESREVPFLTAQQVNLPACSTVPHCPFNAERQAGKLWIPMLKSFIWPDSESSSSDYSSRGRRSINWATCAVKLINGCYYCDVCYKYILVNIHRLIIRFMLKFICLAVDWQQIDKFQIPYFLYLYTFCAFFFKSGFCSRAASIFLYERKLVSSEYSLVTGKRKRKIVSSFVSFVKHS